MRLPMLRRRVLIAVMALLFATSTGSAWLSTAVGNTLTPAGACEDGQCHRRV